MFQNYTGFSSTEFSMFSVRDGLLSWRRFSVLVAFMAPLQQFRSCICWGEECGGGFRDPAAVRGRWSARPLKVPTGLLVGEMPYSRIYL